MGRQMRLFNKKEKSVDPIRRAGVERPVLVVLIFLLVTTGAMAAGGDAAGDDTAFFTLVLLPDTQFYSKRYHRVYYEQARWIVDHRDQWNIKLVIHLGDVTHDNTHAQWAVADKAHKILEAAGIPYTMVPGNHDMPETGEGRRRDTARYNKYFGPHRFAGKEWYGGHMGSDNDNQFVFFEHGVLQFMVVGLEFAPRKEALAWADHLIRQHPGRRVAIVTHC